MLCMFALVACLAGCVSPPFRTEIEAANRQLAERFNAGDYAAVAATYLDDAVLLGPRGYRVEGREAIDAYWVKEWTNARWTLKVLGLEGTADMPVQRGRSILEYDRPGGRHVSDVLFLVVWRRQPDGAYRIAVDAYWRDAD